jgi:hypothetical protein
MKKSTISTPFGRMPNPLAFFPAFLFAFLFLAPALHAAKFYVKTDGSDSNTGISWGQAFLTIQKAIETASSGDEIWVKAGAYLPTKDPFGSPSPTDPRDKTFYLKNGVALYGGFDGSETMRSERDWVANVTTLSGDIGTSGDNSDNAYHVVLSVSDANATVLDGFTVEKGNAN